MRQGMTKLKLSCYGQVITNGFDIGYEGPQERKSESSNIPLTVGSKVELWNKLMKEVAAKRVAGPFTDILYQYFMQSPIGLVPKTGGKTRLIFHLSYNFDKTDKLGSLNEHTPKNKCTVRYRDLDHAVRAYLKLIREDGNPDSKGNDSQKTVFGGKTDTLTLTLLKKCWKWLIMKAQDPQTGVWKYFADKCLPFGASISCALFQQFSDALCFLAEYKMNTPHGMITI